MRVSINSRGEQIGELNIWSDQTELSETDLQLLKRISTRLGQTLETARLFEDAQRLAGREQQINRITTEIRSSNNLETILQKTIREIGQSLEPRVPLSRSEEAWAELSLGQLSRLVRTPTIRQEEAPELQRQKSVLARMDATLTRKQQVDNG